MNLFILIVFLFLNLIVYFSNSWFIFFPKEYFYPLSFVAYLTQFFIRTPILRSPLWLIVSVLVSAFSLMIIFPVRNLDMGDGILLLSTFSLESFYFGYHLTFDEVLEGLFHSFVYNMLGNKDTISNPVLAYKVTSSIFGFFFLVQLFYYFKKWSINLYGYLIVLLSGGMYLFFGYAENYTIVSFFIWSYLLFSVDLIKRTERGLLSLFTVCVFASIVISLHLVSGYLIFSLIFICYFLSEKKNFVRYSIASTVICILLISPIFIYFSFFSEVRFDFMQTHFTNPKFYPIKKIFQPNHFRDILFIFLGSAFLPFIYFFYLLIFKFKLLKNKIREKPEIQFLLFALLGFLIHGFVHFPQLGFPADWDLLSFFWTALVLVTVLLNHDLEDNLFIGKLLPISFFIFLFNAYANSKLNLNKEAELNETLKLLNSFVQEERIKIHEIQPKHKKFYLKAKFFLFESKRKMEEKKGLPSQELQSQNKLFNSEIDMNILNVNLDWQKDYYKRLTKYHFEYLEFLKKE